MRLYRTSAGQWVGTQAEAGRKGTWEQIDVPTDKDGLLAFLNGARPVTAATSDTPVGRLVPSDTVQAREIRETERGRTDLAECPACHRSERAAELVAKRGDANAIGGWIWQAEPWQLEAIFATIGGRIAELRFGAEG